MSQKSWLKSLVERVSKSSPASNRKRPAPPPIALEVLEDRNAPATLAWTGAAGANWSTAGNWSPSGVPSATNNVLVFSSATAGLASYTSNNDITGLIGLTINITDTNTTTGNDFTIAGSNVGLTALTNNKTDGIATASTVALGLTGAGATIAATAGELSISNTANVFDAASSLNVPTGGSADIAVLPSGSLGNAKINVTGGKLSLLGPSYAITPNSLLQQWYNTSTVAQDESFLNAMGTSPNGGLFTLPATGSNFLTTSLAFPTHADFDTAASTPITGDPTVTADTFGFLWTGEFTAKIPGTYTFQVGTFAAGVDDEMVILIDLNDDGVFDNATERVADTIGVGCCGNGASRISPTFTAGATHRIAIGFQEFGGGEHGSAEFSIAGDSNFGSLTAINPGDPLQDGMWSYALIPAVTAGTLPNSVSVSGASTIDMSPFITGATMGNLTVASGATLNVTSGASGQLAFGTTSLGGNVTFNTGAGATLKLAGVVSQTAAAAITKSGVGTLILNAANTYTGATTINAGTVIAGANGALGTATGAADGTTVLAGGHLVIGTASYTNAENVFLNGTGSTASNGALANSVSSTFAGPIALQSNAWITAGASTFVLSGGIANAGFQATLAGAATNMTIQSKGISGTGKVQMAGTGIVNFNVANTFSGDLNVASGTIRVRADGALGTTAGVTNVASGASLDFVGPLTYATLEPINIAGSGPAGGGAINSPGASVTLNAPLTLTGSATIGSANATGKLTIAGTIAMPLVANLSFTGAGAIDVLQAFGNGTAPVSTSKGLFAQYLHNSANRTGTDMTGVGVAPGNQGLLVPGTVWEGNGYLQGPLNVFDNNSPATPSTVNGSSGFAELFGSSSLDITAFSVYYSGVMNVTAAGAYKFATGPIGTLTSLAAPDAQGAVYIDTNQNHIFEDSNTELILNANANGTSATVNLSPGSYDILIPFTNGTGSGGMNISYSSDNGATYQLIDPSKGVVANTSFTSKTPFTATPKNSVIMNGTGVVTLLGNDTYNGTTTINSGTLVPSTPSALGSTSSVVVKSGGTLGLQGGINLTVPVKVAGDGQGGVGAINSLGGTNTIAGPLTLTSSATIGAAAGVLNLNSAIGIPKVANIAFTGDGNINVAQAFGNGNVAITTPNALLQQWYSTPTTAGIPRDDNFLLNMGNDANGGLLAFAPATGSNFLQGPLSFNSTAAFQASAAVPITGSPTVTEDDFSFLWTGTFKATIPGNYTFGVGQTSGGVDDEMTVLIDLNNDGVFDNATEKFADTLGVGCCGNGTSRFSHIFAAGETHRIAIGFQEFGGGNVGSATFMIDNDPNFGALVSIDPSDPNQAGMWSSIDQPLNNVSKSGNGTVTFMASNTYNGNTTVTGGTLNANASTALGINPASTLTVSGATAVVNLFNNASAVTTFGTVNFKAGSGTVNTGALGGKLAIKNQLLLSGGYTVAGDMTAQGANLVDNTAPRTLTANSGTLSISHVPIALPDNGQLFVTGANQSNSLTYTAAATAKVLIVDITGRTDNANDIPTVTYGGTPLLAAVNSMGQATTYVNSHIFYLYNPPTGVANTLQVNFPSALNTSSAVYAFTLDGVDTTFVPTFASAGNTEGSPVSQSLTLANVPAGSWVVSEHTYRIGTSGAVNTTTTNGTPISTGTGGGGGTFWSLNDATVVAGGGLIANVGAGDVTVTATGPAAAGSHFSYAAAVFEPDPNLIPINLPKTNIVLPNGANLNLNAAGANVIGNVTLAGNASIGAGATTNLTVGGVDGTGARQTLAINNGIGLKLAAGSTFKVELNGALPGSQYDQTTVTGAVNLNGATLSASAGFAPTVGSIFTIISNDGSDPVVGTFAGLAQGATLVAGAATFTISYTGGDGNDVVLTAAPAGAATTTSLVATPLASTGGSPVQFTATVNPSPAALGTVTFLDGGVAIPGGSNIPVVAGVAVFSTSTLAVGTHSVTAAYSGAAGFAPSTSTAQSVVVSAGGTAPSIVGPIALNGGLTAFAGDQHSRVINLQVVFDQAVQLDTDALTLALHTNGIVYNGGELASMGTVPTLVIASSTDKKTWTVTFTGTGVETGADGFASLTDGVYDFKVDATKVHPVGNAGVNMAASSTLTFHRLFGDVNLPAGTAPNLSAVVNTTDNLQFRTAFGNLASYKAYLDFNGDGQINTSDNFQFRTRFSKTLSWTV